MAIWCTKKWNCSIGTTSNVKEVLLSQSFTLFVKHSFDWQGEDIFMKTHFSLLSIKILTSAISLQSLCVFKNATDNRQSREQSHNTPTSLFIVSANPPPFCLGKPPFQKSAVFLNIVQKAPPFYLNICPILQGVFFERVFEHLI